MTSEQVMEPPGVTRLNPMASPLATIRPLVPTPYDHALARWYPLKPHAIQQSLTTDRIRFKVVPAGRRSGKTERVKRFMAREAMQVPGTYFMAAPTRDQVKRIFWNDMKLLSFSDVMPKPPSESDLIIYLPNGSSINLIGLDVPARMEGINWTGGCIDEIADVKGEAWAENISPALDTINPLHPDQRAWCILLGVPDGRNHYFDLAEYARTSGDPDWKLYTWFSSDILPADIIEAARRRMSLKQFQQEYEAAFTTSSGRIYDDYSEANCCHEKIQPHEQLGLTCDFNYAPMSSAIFVLRDDDILFLEEIILTSAVAQQTALEFVERYKDHANRSMVLYGDPAGKAGEKHYQESDFTSMEKVLREAGWHVTRKVAHSTLSIKAGQNAVRAKVCNAFGERSLFVNPNTAPYVHKSLNSGQLKPGSAFLETEDEWQHVGTAVRYAVDILFPVVVHSSGPIQLRGSL